MVVEAMAERANLSKVDAEAALVAFMETVADSVSGEHRGPVLLHL